MESGDKKFFHNFLNKIFLLGLSNMKVVFRNWNNFSIENQVLKMCFNCWTLSQTKNIWKISPLFKSDRYQKLSSKHEFFNLRLFSFDIYSFFHLFKVL